MRDYFLVINTLLTVTGTVVCVYAYCRLRLNHRTAAVSAAVLAVAFTVRFVWNVGILFVAMPHIPPRVASIALWFIYAAVIVTVVKDVRQVDREDTRLEAVKRWMR